MDISPVIRLHGGRNVPTFPENNKQTGIILDKVNITLQDKPNVLILLFMFFLISNSEYCQKEFGKTFSSLK